MSNLSSCLIHLSHCKIPKAIIVCSNHQLSNTSYIFLVMTSLSIAFPLALSNLFQIGTLFCNIFKNLLNKAKFRKGKRSHFSNKLHIRKLYFQYFSGRTFSTLYRFGLHQTLDTSLILSLENLPSLFLRRTVEKLIHGNFH